MTVPKIVSVDDHVVEPAHVWQTWLPEKYREQGPDIVDNNRDSIIETNLSALRSVASADQTVRYLGETPCLGIEPFRLLFVVERQ